ncbi:hypothetical protein [Cerasicoccus arenae]|uniref:Uncharacterized protein n=1 Tax=Cerasicoccus arenae TaxID=424488 RepID=A0A8J3DBL7_9BACT|nr:hypothetical protein [Cerasicoccus arenae]MBK1858026.1 hypothetical protein [Cerasicoccus arenae]GHC06589.1 hypothetical protein GCM10007047_24490 [Cerasicoccus arenae]
MKYCIMIMLGIFAVATANYENARADVLLADEGDPCNPVPTDEGEPGGGSDCMGEEFVA